MFNRRRYNRKSGNRKGFRPRVRRKGVILKPPEQNQPVIQKLDFDASGAAPYLWQFFPQSEPIRGKAVNDKVLSLKEICARSVAENADALEPSYLSTCSWTCWRYVWRVICQRSLDLPYVFKMFAKHFSSMPDFKCHYINPADSVPRFLALGSTLLPVRSHRVDNMFANISHNDFVNFMSGLDAHVILDCSGLKGSKNSQVLSFCNIPHLAGLDLSHNEWVDDQFLYTFGRAISCKNLQKLRLLRLVNCPNVTNEGFLRFLRELLAQLSFISSDIRASTKSAFCAQLEGKTEIGVPGSQWRLLQASSPHYNVLVKYNLTKSAHYLLRNTDIVDILTQSPIWDIKLYPEVIDSRNSADLYSKLLDSWKSRKKSSMLRPTSNSFVYMKNEANPIDPSKVEGDKPRDNSASRTFDSPLTQRVPRRKPVHKLRDTKALFR